MNPTKSDDVDVIDVKWWILWEDFDHSAVPHYVELARKYFPALVPVRFSNSSGKNVNVRDTGIEAFYDAIRQESYTANWKASKPTLSSFHLWPYDENAKEDEHFKREPIQFGFSIDRNSLRDRAVYDAFRGFFIEFSKSSKAFLATAELDSWEWSGGDLWTNSKSYSYNPSFGYDGWAGLPDIPIWWTWYGHDYAPFVKPHLLGDVEVFEQGLSHETSPEPPGYFHSTELPMIQNQSQLPPDLRQTTGPNPTPPFMPRFKIVGNAKVVPPRIAAAYKRKG